VTTSSGGSVTNSPSGGISIPSSAPSTPTMTAAELENRLGTIPFYSACTVTVNDGTFIVKKSDNTIAEGSADEVMRKFENELGWEWNPQTKKFEANLSSTVLSRSDNKGITQVKINGQEYKIDKNFGLSNDLKSIKVENSSYTRGSSEPKTIEYKQVANGYYAKGDELYRFSHLDATQQSSAGDTLNFEKVTFDSLPIGTTAKYDSDKDYVEFTRNLSSGQSGAQTICVPIEQAEDFALQLRNLFMFNNEQALYQNVPGGPLTTSAGTAESFAPNKLLSNAITEKFSDLAGFVETPELSYDAQSVTMYGVKITDFGQLGQLVGELTNLKSGNIGYTVSKIVTTDNETFTITLKKAGQDDKTEGVKLSKTPEIYDELGDEIAKQLNDPNLETIEDATYDSETGKITIGNSDCGTISALNQELEKYGQTWNTSTQKVEPYLGDAYFTSKRDAKEDVTVKVGDTELTISSDNNDKNTANQFVATGNDGTRYTFKKVGDEYQLASIVDQYGIEAEIKSQITPELKSIDKDGIQFDLPDEQKLPKIIKIDDFISKINTSLDVFGSEVAVTNNEDFSGDNKPFKIDGTAYNMQDLVEELKNKGYDLDKATGEVTLVKMSEKPISLEEREKKSLLVTKDGGKEFSFGLKGLNDSEKAILGVYNFDKTSKGLDGYEAGHAFKDYQAIAGDDGIVSNEDYANALEGQGYEHLRGISYNDYDGFAKKLIGKNELLLNDTTNENAYTISANNGGMKFEETAEIKDANDQLLDGTRKMDNEFRTVAHENGIEEITYRENGIHIITFSGEPSLSVEIKVKNAEELKETLEALKNLSGDGLNATLKGISLSDDSGYTTVIDAKKGTIEYYLNDINNGRSDTLKYEVKIADAQSFKTQLSKLYDINNQLPDGYKVQLIQNPQGKFKLGNQNVEMGSISSNALNVALSNLGITLSDNNSTPDQNKTISVVNNIAELQKNTNLTLPEKLVLSKQNYEKLVNDMALFSKLVNDSGCRLEVVQNEADDYTLNILGSDNSPISFDDLKSKVKIDDITVNGDNFDIKLNNSGTVSATNPLNALLELAKAGIELPITDASDGIAINNTALVLYLNTGKFSYTIGENNYDIDIKDAKSFVTQYNQFSELNNILPDSNKLSLTQADGKLKIGEKEVEVAEIINEATNAVKTMTSCPSLKYDQEKDAFFVDSTQLTPEALACLIEFIESKQDTNYEVTAVAIESGKLSITYKYKDNDNVTKEKTEQVGILE